MKRDLYNKLLIWKQSASRKPLILNGARQVGKTWLLKEFGKNEYKSTALISLDRDESAKKLFDSTTDTNAIVRGLSSLSGVDIKEKETLLIIDEIQECPNALTALKFFAEDLPNIHIAVAGSLLGVSLHQGNSYPVGKVDELRLYPMTFSEFLEAMGKEKMVQLLKEGDWNLINALSDTFVDLLRQYYFVGGMPAAVSAYVSSNELITVRKIQQQILRDYERDFSKYAPSVQVPRIKMVWNSIVSQLAKENRKFIYNALKKGARAKDFELAIEWLIDAGLVSKVCLTRSVQMPLKFYEDIDCFKLFILDIGLLGAMVQTPASAILVGDNIFKEYKGAFTEEFVFSQLCTTEIPIYYHSVENSRIELDFVIQVGTAVYPVEVKAEENVKAKSMRQFISNHPNLKGLRISMKPHIDQGWLENIPLFAIGEEIERRNQNGL